MNTSSWIVKIEEDPDTGDLILPFPQDLLDLQGWQEGDTLEWVKGEDDSWIIQKVKE